MSSAGHTTRLVADLGGARGTATLERHGWELELSAGTGRLDVPIASGLLNRLVAEVAAAGGGTVRWRVPEPTAEHTRIARASGFGGRRVLWELRRPLPAPPPDPPVESRPFVAGDDDHEWLRVNNAAFDWHAEQGGWGPTELHARQREPWFDPAGLLLHPATPGGGPGTPIAGFCWTKVHHDRLPPLGEIFVIAVDPARTGTGLGRRLVLAGLDHMHLQGIGEAMLYTEADNAPAVGLYRQLGFEEHHQVRVFDRVIPPGGQTPTPTAEPIP